MRVACVGLLLKEYKIFGKKKDSTIKITIFAE